MFADTIRSLRVLALAHKLDHVHAALCRAFAEYGIPVYEVRPDLTKTDRTASVTSKYDDLIVKGLVPQNR